VPVTLGSPLVGYRGKRHWPLRKLIEDHLLPSIATHHGQATPADVAGGAAGAMGATGVGCADSGGGAGAGAAGVEGGEGRGDAPDDERLCPVAYMAQHHLLHQCVPLQVMLSVPPYTLGRSLSPPNLWLGTRGTAAGGDCRLPC
jgi:hypothetical protein